MDIKITNNFQDVFDEIATKVEKALTSCGLDAVNYAMDEITNQGAIDSGDLKNSIEYTVTMDGDSGDMCVGTNIEYAGYVEFGTGIYSTLGGRQTPWHWQDKDGNWHTTRGMIARPYIKPALSDHEEDLVQTIEDVLKE